MLGSTVPRTVTLLSLGGGTTGPQTWLGAFGIPFSCGVFFGGSHGAAPCPVLPLVPLWHVGEPGTGRGDIGGGPWRDEQGHRVEAGKVVRTWSLNLN